jgi:transposase
MEGAFVSRQIRADYSQGMLLPHSLEEWVGPEHPARFIRAFVEAMDLGALGVQWNAGVAGRPTYGADLLLEVWLYGYFVGLRSTRKLEAACREQMGMLWLTGMNAPDHNTLWRFFERNRGALRGLFTQSVRVARDAGLVGMVLHALDGTKIGAQVSTAGGWHRDKLNALLGRLDEIVKDWEREIEETAAPDEPGTGLPEPLHDEEALREKIRNALEGLRRLDEAGQNHLHPDEPEARVMKCSDINANRFAYNSQIVVDADSNLIVGQDVCCQANDQHQLAPMLAATQDTLGACAALTVADAGYASGQAFYEADRDGRQVAVNLPASWTENPNPYHASHFDYDPQHNEAICPRGQRLSYTHTRQHRHKKHPLHHYRCHHTQCPVRQQCTRDPKGRGIELSPYHENLQHHRQRLHEPELRHALTRRAGIVEKIFGTLKHDLNFRRYTLRGLDKVRTQWALICTTYNLRKLYTQWLHPKPKPHTTTPKHRKPPRHSHPAIA